MNPQTLRRPPVGEASPPVGNTPERIAFLKESIQKHFDDDNWYGRDSRYEKRQILKMAAHLELLEYGVIFKPVYNCPA